MNTTKPITSNPMRYSIQEIKKWAVDRQSVSPAVVLEMVEAIEALDETLEKIKKASTDYIFLMSREDLASYIFREINNVRRMTFKQETKNEAS